jgi:predicted metalloprotease with PDZ domain
MEIRRASGNERSLDDLMRLLWERYGARDTGFPEDPAAGIRALAEEVYGGSLETFFDRFVHGTEELDLADALSVVGLHRHIDRPQTPPSEASRSKAPASPADPAVLQTRLGVRIAAGGPGARVTHVLDGSPAHAAGLNAGDEIIALDGLRVTDADLPARIRHQASGETVSLTLFRRDELLGFELPLAEMPPTRTRLAPIAAETERQAAAREDWLGVRAAN